MRAVLEVIAGTADLAASADDALVANGPAGRQAPLVELPYSGHVPRGVR